MAGLAEKEGRQGETACEEIVQDITANRPFSDAFEEGRKEAMKEIMHSATCVNLSNVLRP